MPRKLLRTIDEKIEAETDLAVLIAMADAWTSRNELNDEQRAAIARRKIELQRRR